MGALGRNCVSEHYKTNKTASRVLLRSHTHSTEYFIAGFGGKTPSNHLHNCNYNAMGTRSLICIFFQGRFVVAQYSQWDGYPERGGQGMKILRFLRRHGNIQRLKHGLQYITILCINEGEAYQRLTEIEATEQPSLSRDTGAGILEIIAEATDTSYVPIFLDLEFANDGLFCEWAYVIDLDDELFEVFSGADRKEQASSKRFDAVGGEQDTVPAFVRGFGFQALPNTEAEFIEKLNEAPGAGGEDQNS